MPQIKNPVLIIKRLLKEKGLTYKEFARLIGKSEPTVVNWFKGRSKIDIETLQDIAKVLGVTPCYFFDCGTTTNSQNVSNTGIVAGSNVSVQQNMGQNEAIGSELSKLKAELEGYKRLVAEKDERIKELKEIIEVLKQIKK